jgi:hypothetical protein
MPYTTTNLITDAFYLSSVLSEEFETITGYQINKGLQLLNDFIEFKTAQDRLIPFISTVFFDAISSPETEKYAIPGLIEVETLTFTWQTIRYPMRVLTRSQYFGTGRANNIDTLPNTYFVEKRLGGADIYLYPLPNLDYTFEIKGKFSLVPLALGQDVYLFYPKYYIPYLKYGLADYICQDYQIDFPQKNKDQLNKYECNLYDNSPVDFSMQKTSILQSSTGNTDIYYRANILKGWNPPG